MTGFFKTSAAVLTVTLFSLGASADPGSSLSEAGMTYTEKGWTFSEVAEQNWKQAEETLEAQVDANPDDPFRLLNLAYVYTKTEKAEDAVAVYERILDLEVNPMATLTSGQEVRAKKVAKDALASLGASE